MASDGFLHNHSDFSALLRIVAQEQGIDPVLVEKDYWIMHCLYGLQNLGLNFELKGGTSLSKGFGLIHRFSEDIDIRIEPPEGMDVKSGRNQDKPEQCDSRKKFYDWLASTIKIDGIDRVLRDTAFDDSKYRSGGIRLYYKNHIGQLFGVKEGILLEVGFDDITPNFLKTISSWAYDFAASKVPIIDNRALNVSCYHAGYTLVEKLQTISTKYRRQQEADELPTNFMRHYYDVFCLLQDKDVLAFIGTREYKAHKEKRFRSVDNPVVSENEAFLLNDPETRKKYKAAFEATSALYYKSQPDFDEMLLTIRDNISNL
jgi:hypothetical protein